MLIKLPPPIPIPLEEFRLDLKLEIKVFSIKNIEFSKLWAFMIPLHNAVAIATSTTLPCFSKIPLNKKKLK